MQSVVAQLWAQWTWSTMALMDMVRHGHNGHDHV